MAINRNLWSASRLFSFESTSAINIMDRDSTLSITVPLPLLVAVLPGVKKFVPAISKYSLGNNILSFAELDDNLLLKLVQFMKNGAVNVSLEEGTQLRCFLQEWGFKFSLTMDRLESLSSQNSLKRKSSPQVLELESAPESCGSLPAVKSSSIELSSSKQGSIVSMSPNRQSANVNRPSVIKNTTPVVSSDGGLISQGRESINVANGLVEYDDSDEDLVIDYGLKFSDEETREDDDKIEEVNLFEVEDVKQSNVNVISKSLFGRKKSSVRSRTVESSNKLKNGRKKSREDKNIFCHEESCYLVFATKAKMLAHMCLSHGYRSQLVNLLPEHFSRDGKLRVCKRIQCGKVLRSIPGAVNHLGAYHGQIYELREERMARARIPSQRTGSILKKNFLSKYKIPKLPRNAGINVAAPQLASPQLASPRLVSPRLASPRLASPQLDPPGRFVNLEKQNDV